MDINQNLKDVEESLASLSELDSIIPHSSKDMLCAISDVLKRGDDVLDKMEKQLQTFVDRVYFIRKTLNDKIDLVEEEFTNRILKEINE